MNILDRIILTIYTACVALASILLILFSARMISLDVLWTRLAVFYGRWEVGAVGSAVMLISLKLLLSGIKSRHFTEAMIHTGDLGNISISLNAIENLISKITHDVENVKDVKVQIKKKANGISVLLNLVVNYDIVIPELSSTLQKSIKNYIETKAGITVNDINVRVDNVFNPNIKQRMVK